VKPIKITRTKSGSSSREFIAGISGIELSHKYIKELMLESSKTAKTEYQFTCHNNDNVWCYMMDFSGYILASNQNETIDETRNERIDVGDFLGTVDPSLMRHLILEGNIFDERPEYNYAALCETPVDCTNKINSAPANHISYLLSFPLKFILSFLKSSVTFIYQLNITVLSSLLSLWLPKMGEASLFEFYSAIPEGCHRCTTKTSNWYLKPDLFTNGDSTFEEFYPCDINQAPIVEDSHNVSLEENLEGSSIEGEAENIEGLSTSNPDLIMKVKKNTCEKTDKRRYHLYRFLKINAILIVVDPPERPHKFDGKREEWSDGPIEVKNANNSCLLPDRYRKRPKTCYSYDENETTDCNKGVTARKINVQVTFLLVVAVMYLYSALY